ncbi:MAG: methyltransferase domain-containing protein [Alphaproteobacteria bacterium]|nr:MAG: methyltransferase domain-containing protein [Alphaproteobacteria bacterium]
MWMDVVDLRDFYATSLGQVTSRVVRRRIREIWPDLTRRRVLGLGYGPPYLRPFLDDAERVIAAMPAGQGVIHWPPGGPDRTVLVDEAELPFADNSIDRILLVHGIENSEQLRPMLREVWRVLSDSGRMLAVVPNRHGIWARLERTPFGHGHPFTPGQLSRLLRDCLFTPSAEAGALFMPPARSRMVLGAAPAWEKVGSRWFPRFAGVVLMEAGKQIYAASPVTAQGRRRTVVVPADVGLPRLIRR